MKKLVTLLGLCLIIQVMVGQQVQTHNAVSQKIDQHHKTGKTFIETNVFQSHSSMSNRESVLRRKYEKHLQPMIQELVGYY